MKIRICTPFYQEFESIKSGVRECLKYDKIQFQFEPRQSGPCMFKNRNSLLNDQKSQLKKQNPLYGFDYFLFVDSDISFTLNNVLNLLNHDKEIISCPYFTHDNNGKYNCGEFVETFPGMIKFNYTKHDKGLKDVGFIGAGFLLIKRSALEKIEYPWFEPFTLDMGDKAESVGEDLSFCIKARKNNIQIFCDFDDPVNHILRKQTDFNWDININTNRLN